jgi:hypothetical protein
VSTPAAWERAMRIQDVLTRAMSGEIHWFRAAEILQMTPQNLRRWRERYEKWGYDGLVDQRRCPSKEWVIEVNYSCRSCCLTEESYPAASRRFVTESRAA